MAKEFVKGKMVPVPSHSIVPERDLGKLPVLECQHLGIDFGGLTAVNDFNLTVGQTEIAGLIGPNGAGKTTVFNLLTKVYQPTRGTILLNGKDTHGMSIAQANRAGIARTFQNIRLFNNLSVEDNVKIGLQPGALPHVGRCAPPAQVLEAGKVGPRERTGAAVHLWDGGPGQP